MLSNKYAEFFYFDRKRNNPGKDALNLLGWSEIRKTEIHPTRILPEPEIHPIRILPEPIYTRSVFNPPARTNRCKLNPSVNDDEDEEGDDSLIVTYLFMK